MIHLGPVSYEEYRDSRVHRFSEAARLFDPDMPIPSVEREEKWWHDAVGTGAYRIWSIRNGMEEVCGFVSVFDMNAGSGECETGIIVFPENNYRKGYAKAAVSILLADMIPTMPVQFIRAEVNRDNVHAVHLYGSFGFRTQDEIKDGSVFWKIMTKTIR